MIAPSSTASLFAASRRGVFVLLAFAWFAGGSAASAGILTVTNASDAGAGSLRNAIATASPGDTIFFDRSLDGATIILGGSELTIDKNLTIDASSLPNGLAIDANASSRIFALSGGPTVILQSLVIRNGASSGTGAAIAGSGNLYISNCRIIENNGTGTGGAILGQGTLTLVNSTIADNSCGNVSALYVSNCDCTIVGCTISGNVGNSISEALRFEAGSNRSLLVVNSTFSGNESGNGVAAIRVVATATANVAATILNSTITGNSVASAAGGGFFGPAGGFLIEEDPSANVQLTLHNTIVSGNTAGGLPADISGGLETGSSSNLIGTGGLIANGVDGNLVGINDPLLGPLAANGGPTLTHMPITNSPALDASATGEAIDQRGASRPAAGAFDIGAVEGVDHSAARAELNGQISVLRGQISALGKRIARARRSGNRTQLRQFSVRLRKSQAALRKARADLADLG